MSFQTLPENLRISEFTPIINFPNGFEELDDTGWDSAKRFNLDSDLPEYVGRGTVGVWENESGQNVLTKTEKRNVRNQIDEKDFDDFSELEKAIMFGELGISPKVHSYRETDRGVKRDFVMDFLGDYTNFEDKSFDSINEMEPYAESTGYIMGVLNELGMVHGDIISTRTHSYSEGNQDFEGTPVINNLLVAGRSDDVMMIDPEVTRFSNEGESHRWDRASSSYDMMERRSSDPNTEAGNVWTAFVSEALTSTQLGSLVDQEEITYFVEDESGVERRKTDFARYLEEQAGESLYHVDHGIPRFDSTGEDLNEHFNKEETANFAREVDNITENYVNGFESGRTYVINIDWPNNNSSVEEYLQEIKESL